MADTSTGADTPTAAPDSPQVDKVAPVDSDAHIKKLEAELAKFREEAKEAFKERDKLRKEREDSEKKAAEEQGKFKELYEKANAELESLKPFKERYEDLEKQTREQLLAQIPEDKRENVKGLDLTALRVIVDTIGTTPKVNNAGGFSNGKGAPPAEKMYDEYTPDEAREFIQKNGGAAWTQKVQKDERLKLTKKV